MHTVIYPYLWLLWDPTEAWPYLKYRRQVAAAERLDHAAMRRLQWERLTKLISYAYEKVPYYHRTFKEAGIHPSAICTPEDFSRIPILTRRDVQDNLEDLVPTDCDRSTLVLKATGGSTGTPMRFYDDRQSSGRQAAVKSRSDAWRGYRQGDKLAVVWGAAQDNPQLSLFARFRLIAFLRQQRLNSYAMTVEGMEEFARLLIKWRPRHIHAYAASAYIFASFLKDRGLDSIRPISVSTSAEKLWGYQRSMIEDVFKCRVFDLYGSREVPNVAAECEMHRGLHVNSDNVYLELLDRGRPALSGEVGEVIVTPLLKRSMPLIRYRNGDLACAGGEACPCGRPFPLLAEIIGRQNDVLVTPAGEYVHTPGGALFSDLFLDIPGVTQFQIHQKTVDQIVISIVGKEQIVSETLALVRSRVTQRLGTGVEVAVSQVKYIPHGPSGKHRYIISDVGPALGTSDSRSFEPRDHDPG